MAPAKKSDSWDKFIVRLECDVLDVKVMTSPIYTEVGERIIGGSVDMALSGYKSETELLVESDVVKKMIFDGIVPVYANDRIRAYVPAANRFQVYEKKRRHVYDDGTRYKFEKRPLKKEERAFKIEKIDPLGKVLATYETPVTIAFLKTEG